MYIVAIYVRFTINYDQLYIASLYICRKQLAIFSHIKWQQNIEGTKCITCSQVHTAKLQLAVSVCLSRVQMEPFEDHWSTPGCLKKLTAEAARVTFSFNTWLNCQLMCMYSYHLMVKRVPCCCVGGRWLVLYHNTYTRTV